MIVQHRNSQLKYVHDIKKNKMLILFDWLLEFRFSTIDILSQRIGSKPTNSYRLFKQLINDRYIQKFSNIHTYQNFFMLKNSGIDYLKCESRDISCAVTNPNKLSKYSTIMHDLLVQKAILNRIHLFDEVIWDKNIERVQGFDRPDALLRTKVGDNVWLALEYERWDKSKPRVYKSFINHLKSIANNRYSGVLFIMNNDSDLDKYKKYFNEKYWPVYEKYHYSKYRIIDNKILNPSSLVSNYQHKFMFILDDHID